MEYLQGDTEAGRLVQGGVTFESVCTECNENRLGRQYDPELKRLCKALDKAHSAARDLRLSLPNPIRLSCKSQRVARAVVGHLLSAIRDEEVGAVPTDSPSRNAMRAYFLDPSMPLPRSLRIYCWRYRGSDIVIVRGLAKIHRGDPYLGSILKFPHIGFWVLFQPPDGLQFPAHHLLQDRALGLDAEELVPFDLVNVIHERMPEAPTDQLGGVSMFSGAVGLVASPRWLHARRKKRKRTAR